MGPLEGRPNISPSRSCPGLWLTLLRPTHAKMLQDRWPLSACAVKRRRFPVGASPTRRMLQPEAIGAVRIRPEPPCGRVSGP